ncbi:hypothetical protein DPMN_078690 [Dreissena polymorpha]|uniref:Uncharacterized protein n=1 Tax=Dreissena polymorpha TaxID=45954 RepID=A0A9D3YMQ0_DREPO|nr:hypothetical protein DPMN_078690 [Dreissena polymorpha]
MSPAYTNFSSTDALSPLLPAEASASRKKIERVCHFLGRRAWSDMRGNVVYRTVEYGLKYDASRPANISTCKHTNIVHNHIDRYMFENVTPAVPTSSKIHTLHRPMGGAIVSMRDVHRSRCHQDSPGFRLTAAHRGRTACCVSDFYLLAI